MILFLWLSWLVSGRALPSSPFISSTEVAAQRKLLLIYFLIYFY